jgi:hypothetical protein
MEQRLRRLESAERGAASLALLHTTVEQVAAEEGLDPRELVQETEAILRQHHGKPLAEIAAILEQERQEWEAR